MINNQVLVVALCCCTPTDLHQLLIRSSDKPTDQQLQGVMTQMGVDPTVQAALLHSTFFDHVVTNKAAFAGIAQVVARPELSYDDPPCPTIAQIYQIIKALP